MSAEANSTQLLWHPCNKKCIGSDGCCHKTLLSDSAVVVFQTHLVTESIVRRMKLAKLQLDARGVALQYMEP